MFSYKSALPVSSSNAISAYRQSIALGGYPAFYRTLLSLRLAFPGIVDELLFVVNESSCTSANPGLLTFSSPRFAFPTGSSESVYTIPSLNLSGPERVMITIGSGVPGRGGSVLAVKSIPPCPEAAHVLMYNTICYDFAYYLPESV